MLKHAAVVTLAFALVAALGGCPKEGDMDRTPGPEGETYEYTVTAGDKDFEDVSVKVYGDADYADEIAEANPDVKSISAGQKLTIPAIYDEEGNPIAPKGCTRKRIY